MASGDGRSPLSCRPFVGAIHGTPRPSSGTVHGCRVFLALENQGHDRRRRITSWLLRNLATHYAATFYRAGEIRSSSRRFSIDLLKTGPVPVSCFCSSLFLVPRSLPGVPLPCCAFRQTLCKVIRTSSSHCILTPATKCHALH